MPTHSEMELRVKEAIAESGSTLVHPYRALGGWTLEQSGEVYLGEVITRATQAAMTKAGDGWGPKGSQGQGMKREYTTIQALAILNEIIEMGKKPTQGNNFKRAGITEDALRHVAAQLILT